MAIHRLMKTVMKISPSRTNQVTVLSVMTSYRSAHRENVCYNQLENSDEQKPKKHQKKNHSDEIIDTMLIKSLSQMNEVSAIRDDEDELFGRQIAATLHRFSNCQKAFAKMQIRSLLMNMEFPAEEHHFMPQAYTYHP